MLGKTRFVNFFDLLAFRSAKKLSKLPIEESVKAAFLALERNQDEVNLGSVGIKEVRVSRNGNKFVPIEGSIPAIATVFQTQNSSHGSFVTLQVGLATEQVSSQSGVKSASTEVASLSGRVTMAEGGDPSVYFFDNDKKNFCLGFLAAMRLLKQTFLSEVLRKKGLTVRDIVKEEIMREIEISAGESL